MNNAFTSFGSKILQRSNDKFQYDIYKAALEWDLADPIVIQSKEDIRSESKWKGRVEPFKHQITNLITFCRRLPVTLLADDVGLGKTISAGLVMSELISRKRIYKALIVCPKLLLPQWQEELKAKFGISSIGLIGKELVNTKTSEDIQAVITTYDSARLYLDKLDKTNFEMLILDEAHKLRNLYGVTNTPQVALNFRKVLEDKAFKYILMLTATPIQNRLWDIYSLIDLLTVARGHENPFGNPGIFTRKFIEDSPTNARKLNPKAKDEFRNIVYGYMSRIRRADTNLIFPERKVELHHVTPTTEETELYELIREGIKSLNPLSQISILQAFTSSPEALGRQLKNMSEKGSISLSLANEVETIVKKIKITSKLKGLGTLIEQLRHQNPETWRVVIFTERLETQTSIEAFLNEQNIKCGIIKGNAYSANQETIERFKKNNPEINVIISTRAGAEGINLQVANILVNYDLPWNPMIVEQRIGRIQRLASKHANVCIYNIILKGTFEEKIVGRLMEKLQLASHSVGDIEALLEASGLDGNDNGMSGFEDMIRKLVLLSLENKDIEAATLKEIQSITEAKNKLVEEEKNINSMLDGTGTEESGPRCPKLPQTEYTMDYKTFTLNALKSLGADLEQQTNGLYILELDGEQEFIRFDDELKYEVKSTLYEPGSPAFDKLVKKLNSVGLHQVNDEDNNIELTIENIATHWVKNFDANFISFKIDKVWRCFSGKVLLRIRATVAHDSYERLVEIFCMPSEHKSGIGQYGLDSIDAIIENYAVLGISKDVLIRKAELDPGISDFCRFYKERMIEEVKAAGGDLRKRKKLEDDFTPKLEITLVGLEGNVYRNVEISLAYQLDQKAEYKSQITVTPKTSEIIKAPELLKCELTNRIVPYDCLGECAISGTKILKHLLIKSEISERTALPKYTTVCGITGKRVLSDEASQSAISGQLIINSLLKISALSGKKAEPQFFSKCEFTNSEVLESELAISQISGKRYRIDEQLRSAVSGKTGHRDEFIFCTITNQSLLPSEVEKCEITGKIVIPGILEQCEITAKKVIPSELEKSIVSGKKALRKFFVISSLSGGYLLEQEAVKSIGGKFCSPIEAKTCAWSGRKCHPDDLKACKLTDVLIHIEYLSNIQNCLEPLIKLLDGIIRKSEKTELWELIRIKASTILKNKHCKIESAELSPDSQNMAVCLNVPSWMGLKIRYAGFIYSIKEGEIISKVVLGKRESKGWSLEEN